MMKSAYSSEDLIVPKKRIFQLLEELNYTVYDMMEQYENANWQEVSRQLIVNNIDVETISEAYTSALNWYKELTSGKK